MRYLKIFCEEYSTNLYVRVREIVSDFMFLRFIQLVLSVNAVCSETSRKYIL